MPRLLAPMPDIPLMQVPISLVRGGLATAAVRRAPVVVNVGMLLDDRRENTFVDVTSRKVGFAEVGLLVGVIQLEVE